MKGLVSLRFIIEGGRGHLKRVRDPVGLPVIGAKASLGLTCSQGASFEPAKLCGDVNNRLEFVQPSKQSSPSS